MKKLYFLALTFIGLSLYSQNNPKAKEYPAFDMPKYLEIARKKGIPQQDIAGYIRAEKSKYNLEQHPELKQTAAEHITLVNMSRLSNQAIQTTYCPNSDFSLLNYSNWTGDVSLSCVTGSQFPVASWSNTGINGNNGSPVLMNTDPCNGATISTDWQVIMNMQIGPLTNNNTLAFNNGYDPSCLNVNTGMYDLPMVPPGETSSIRLGSAYPNYTSQKLTYALTPTSSMNLFTYQFAVVLNDGGHGVGEQPAFLFAMKDSAGNVLTNTTCFQYNIDATGATTDTSYIQNSASNPCFNSGSSSTHYRKWHTVTIDMSAYIGQTVFAEFQTLDCTFSGHFAYAYISAKCVSGGGHVNMCAGSNVQQLSAPAGFASYQWYDPATTPIAGATYDTLSVFNGNLGDVYSVDCVTLQGCTTHINLTLQYTPLDVLYYNSSFSGTLSGNGTVSMCGGNGINLVAQGANTYTWSANAGGSHNDTVSVNPNTTSLLYTVTGTGSNGCVYSASINFALDTTGCVWPGDADENLVVDNMDLLPVGIKWGKAGAARSFLSSLWYGYSCNDWNDTLMSGINTKYTDCNGSGTVEYGDTLPINVNYNATHPFRMQEQQAAQAAAKDIYLQFNKTLYYPGDTVLADVMIGSSANQQVGFYGAAFTLDYDETSTKSNSPQFTYNNSWVGVVNQDLVKLGKLFSGPGYVDGSLVRILHTNVSGYGKVAQLRLILNDTLYGNGWIYFNISNAVKTDSQGELTSLNCGTDSVAIAVNGVGIAQKSLTRHLSVFPNPSAGNISVNCSENMDEVRITDMLGNTVLVLKPGVKKAALQIEAEGVYFVTVKAGKEITTKKVIVAR